VQSPGNLLVEDYTEISVLQTDPLTHWPCLEYLGTGDVENTASIFRYSLVAVEACLFAEPLLSNSYCMVAYFAVVA
jgi:hypothetical protein